MNENMRQLTQTTNDLTKNALGFTWTLSLFSLQQMANLLTPSKAIAAFENVGRAMQLELGESLRSTFLAGESFPSQIVDLNRSEPSPEDLTAENKARAATDAVPIGTRDTKSLLQGWGPMPFPVVPPSNADSLFLAENASISPDYPFKPNYVEVLGSQMHYVDVGSGDPILLLHGNPTWSYLWRNIIPHLAPLGRCIAPDLIGYGRSDKPDIEYRWADHVKYLEAFIKKMGLRNITLVLHDQGSGLGFHYAMRNENNIKAIAFFEAIIRPYRWDQFSTPEFRELFRKFRSGEVGGEGWKLIVDQNVFIEALLPQSAGRPLNDKEMNYYREPFKEPKSRLPIWQFPRSTPIGGEPPDVVEAVSNYSRRLQESCIPKLLLYAQPGALITEEHLKWARENIKTLETYNLGAGSHFLQESSPHTIGKVVARWIRGLPGNERLRDVSVRKPLAVSVSHQSADTLAQAIKSGVSAEAVQQLIDQAAYFYLYSSPEIQDDSAIYGANGIVGFRITEKLYPFEAFSQPGNARHAVGKFRHRCLFVPDNYVAVPNQLPPPTQLSPGVSQRFVLVDGECRFGIGRDGFYGFGAGQTLPTTVNGRRRLLFTAVGTVLGGFGRFAVQNQGTYVYGGELSSNGGFTGNLMLRVMDQENAFRADKSRSATKCQVNFDGQNTFIIFRGEAIPSDPVRPKMGPDGKQIGLIVEQGLKILQITNSLTREGELQTATGVAGRRIGRVRAHVVFDPKSASGTNLDPIPFTSYDEFEFVDPSGDVIGTFIGDTSEGRVFNTSLAGQQAIRFGGVGRIYQGDGVFQGIQGLMTDNSVVAFEPHVSASVYVLQIRDAEARFRSAFTTSPGLRLV